MKSGSCGNGACEDLSPLRCVAEVVVGGQGCRSSNMNPVVGALFLPSLSFHPGAQQVARSLLLVNASGEIVLPA